MDWTAPRITIVIPSLDGDRDGRLGALLASLRHQTFQSFEVRLMLLDPRQGRAINRAVRAGRGDIILTLDDDSQLGHPQILENLVKLLDSDPTIGIAGASTIPAPDSSPFQKDACRQIPRRYFPVVEHVVDSDMVQHPCLAMRKAVFEEVGGEDEGLIRGLDPLLRHRVREAGYRVVIAPYTWVSHPLPESIRKISRMYFRNGRGSAFASRHFPEKIYELSDGSPKSFVPQRPLLYRAARYPIRMLRSALTLKWIRAVAELSYLAGYLLEYAVGSRQAPQNPPQGRMVTFESPRSLPGAVPTAPAASPRQNAFAQG
jgi:glycosyltransferase involved in cell wall biosynthesis